MLDAVLPVRPDPNTYWVVAGRFVAGEYPSSWEPVKAREKVAAFLKVGITTFIDLTEAHLLEEAVAAVADGSFRTAASTRIRGSGYVMESLEAALWAFDQSATFAEGALLAVNLGEDADTTGAVYGQLAGAFYGDWAFLSGGWKHFTAANSSPGWRTVSFRKAPSRATLA